MTEQQLARALVQAGHITPQQVQDAAKNRAPGVGIAQALIDSGAVRTIDVLQIDPTAFDGAAANPVAAAPPAAEPDEEAIGLGQGGAPALDDSGVLFEGDNLERASDPVSGAIVHFCNALLRQAVEIGASDVHLEPQADGLLPRFRIDGHLRQGETLSADVQLPIISRFKVLAHLDITEQRLPQDGRFRATIGGRRFDFRVSSLPSIHGEKIVLRLLDHAALVTNLTKLGFSSDARASFEQMLNRSYGMILITGPTGSGKTTTLYAALAAAQDETKNVVTVEDPVEYELRGITQTNVNSDIGLSFATQLRAVLRQDPDVILVGEIRDTETADVAIRAALTGHLLLSTLHTNSAVAAITRLQDMDIAPFLIASSLSGVVAQRLVRAICRNCREVVSPESGEYQQAAIRFKLPEGTPIYHGRGCDACGGTGTRGRLAIVEVLHIDAALRRAIVQKLDSDALREIAVQNGMRTLWQDGMDKLTRGLTTAEEISRVLLGAQSEE
ncbi:MAG TPA: GspE/PulE family protein [Abditibacteriaceae bacterium]|jgi:type II secretory ATPase GspE/PulE/Tfp pilus assembly ATPase PilB-like protein